MSSRNDPAWLTEKPLQPPTILGHWDGAPHIMLFKIRSGALLWWMFEDDEDEQLGVFVHLTDREAQAVYDGPADRGLLEPIRETLEDPAAVAWCLSRGEIHAVDFRIPLGGPEPEFAALLWSAAENAASSTRAHSRISRQANGIHEFAKLAEV